MNLRCYICGKAILEKEFSLVAMSQNVDRVFVMHRTCVEQVEKELRVETKVVME